MSTHFLADIRNDLQSLADEKTKNSARYYFKEQITLYGVKTPLVERVATEHFKAIQPLGKQPIFDLCEELFKSGYMEEAFIGCEWSYRLRNDFVPEDFAVFERWIGKYISNWATCDTLCNHTVGSFVDKFPRYVEELKKWTKSGNRWFRRGAAVTLVLPARNGKFLKDILEIADSLLLDEDDLVRKGYGWMLKEASKTHLEEVFSYVIRNKEVMPRTALRYAIEKMPQDLKRKAMAK